MRGVRFRGTVLAALAVLAAASTFGLFPARASAEALCTDSWVGPAEGLWDTAADWSSATVPTATDVACIGAGKAVKANGLADRAGVVQGEGTLVIAGYFELADVLEASRLADLSLTEGTLTVAGELNVSSSLTIVRSPTIAGGGKLTLESGASGALGDGETCSMAGTLDGVTFVNDGTLAFGAGGGAPDGAMVMKNGARLENAGTFDLKSYDPGCGAGTTNLSIANGGGAGSTITNTGTIETALPPGVDGSVDAAFDNDGTVDTSSGVLPLNESGASSHGTWHVASGATVAFTAGSFSQLEGAWSGAGTINVAGGAVTVSKLTSVEAGLSVAGGSLTIAPSTTTTVPTLSLTGGELSGSGVLRVSSSLSILQSPSIGGGATLVLDANATGQMGTSETCSVHLNIGNATLENNGTLTFGASGGTPSGAMEMGGTAQFVNAGTFNVDSWDAGCGLGTIDDSIASAGSTYETFTNTGTLGVDVGEVEPHVPRKTYVYPAFSDSGGISKTAGELIFYDPLMRDSAVDRGGPGNPSIPGEPCPVCGEPVVVATGDLVEEQTDLAVGGRGVGLNLTRTYNSQAAAEGSGGAFGYGWTSSFSDHLSFEESPEKTVTKAILHQADGSVIPFTGEAGGGSFSAPNWTQDKLTRSLEGTYTLTLPSQLKYVFAETDGRLQAVSDRYGNTTTLSYTHTGLGETPQLESVTDPAGRKLTFAYNGEGFVESVTDPMGHTVKYSYESGDLASVTLPGQATPRWRFKYDRSNQLAEMIDGRGGTTLNYYNSNHQVIEQADPMKQWTRFEYQAFQTTVLNETTGATTVYGFTSNDEPFAITRGVGSPFVTTQSFTYNADDYVASETDGNENTTRYGYDAEDNRTSAVDPEGHETKWEYNKTHDVISMTTPRGETTTIKRESDGNPESISRPAPGETTQVTAYKYNPYGELTSVEDPLKKTWKYEYDSYGDRISEVDPEGDERTTSYNEDSQETTSVSPRGHAAGAKESSFTTTIERDALGRPLKITDPLGHETKYEYDANGDLEAVTDPDGEKTSYTYDADDEPTEVHQPNGTVTKTEYDAAGQIVSQTDGNAHTTSYTRNALEQVTEITDPLGRKTREEHDAAGNLIDVGDAAKRKTNYRYDPDNRLIEISYSDGKTPAVKYEYDADGERTKTTDATGESTYKYDQLDRLTEVKDGHGDTVNYEYDLDDRPTKTTYPNGKAVARSYDNAGRLKSVTDWLEHTTTFTYDPDSDLTATTFPTTTGEEDSYAYNDADTMSEVKLKKGTETLASLAYTRDNDALITKATTKGLPGEEEPSFSYDENSRLSKDAGVTYKYDAANNPTTIGSDTLSYDSADELEANELEKATIATYAYNEVGQRTKATPTTGPATSYGYDQADHLTTVSRPKEGATAAIEDAYSYDGEGLRASEDINGSTSYLTWDPTEPLPALLSNGTYSFIYGPDGLPIEQINNSSGTVAYLHHDQQGSTRLLTGSTGTVTGKCSYSAYGTPTCEGSSTTPLGFDGQYTSSDTGLIYMRARVYDPATAQFLTRDPLTAATGAPYSYAGDNPLTYGDPSGLSFGSFLEEVGEGIAGWGDTITFGGTEWVREQLGDNNIDACSGAYEAGGIAGLVTGVLIPGEGEAEIGAEGLDEALAGLRESKAGIYEVDNEEELQALYSELSRGGKPATPTGYDGQMVKLSDGTRVGLRNTSSSGGQTIDINRPGQPPVKVHLP